MRKKRVWRYYCDFCGKGGCYGGHMKKHEAHCTMNPKRVCRVCANYGAKQKPISELIKLIPDNPLEVGSREWCHGRDLTALRDAVEGCPACILTAIRQSGLNNTFFDYKAEMDAFWKQVNEGYERMY